MKISISKTGLKDGINARAHRKEDKFDSSLILVTYKLGKFNQPIDVRFYFTGSTCYCCIWGSIKGKHFSGSGKAGGYGYDKKSAAMSSALQSAGFDVDGLSATGETDLAMKLLAGLNGIKKHTIVYAHG